MTASNSGERVSGFDRAEFIAIVNVTCIKTVSYQWSIPHFWAILPEHLHTVHKGYTGGMTYEGNGDGGISVPPHRDIPHYHGDNTRILFVISAIVLIVAQSTSANLPLSTAGAVISAVFLVVAAGITNPEQGWIHWANAFIAVCGTFLFGMAAVGHYRLGISIFDISFLYTETLALLSLIALYLTTRTIRGFHLRNSLS